jgi:choline dehydrogenase
MSAAVNWDYIIVGAGSAGCALAWQLARGRAQSRILVLESGGPDRSAYIKVPLGQIRAISRYDWGYRSEPDPSRFGTTEAWLRGKVVGGSSSINGMIYVRGAAADFDRWGQLCDHAGRSSADLSRAGMQRSVRFLARAYWAAPCQNGPQAAPAHRGFHPGSRCQRVPSQPGLQRTGAGRGQLCPTVAEERLPLQRG